MYTIDPQKFGERLKNAIKESDMTQKDLAKEIGISKTSVNNYVNGRIPDVAILYELSSFLGVTMEWLLTGKPSAQINLKGFQDLTEEDQQDLEVFLEFLKLRREKKKTNTVSTTYTSNDEPPIAATKEYPIVYLPILGDAAAGIPIEIIELKQGEVPVNEKHSKHNSFVIRARGDSMIEAGIENGALVVVRPQPIVENGEIAVVNINGEATIKYFYLHNGECELRSANPSYLPMTYSTGDISIIGKVVEVINDK
jgi:repressor LexA